MATTTTASKTATNKAANAMSADIRSTEDLENFITVHGQLAVDQADLFANVTVSLHPRLMARLRQAGLDESRMLGLGSSASAAATSVTRHFKVAAELENTAARALKKAWLEYLKNIVEPILAAQNANEEFKI